jgi:hypothetical protein
MWVGNGGPIAAFVSSRHYIPSNIVCIQSTAETACCGAPPSVYPKVHQTALFLFILLRQVRHRRWPYLRRPQQQQQKQPTRVSRLSVPAGAMPSFAV